jgi:hypothetical protein
MERTEEVLERIRSVPGVLKALELDERQQIMVTKLEKQAENTGAAGGLMEFINEGVWKALARKHVVLIVADNEQGFRDPPEPWTLMVDEERNVIGEWLHPERIEEFKGKKNVQFISSDFVLYSDRKRTGKCYFLLPGISFPEIEDIDGVENVVSGSVSPPADAYLKKEVGMTENYWTILVGYDESD